MMDSFDVERRIGQGQFGEAYLVRSNTSGERYVLKKIRINSKEELDRAIKEVLLLKALEHPNIVRYKKAFTASTEDGARVFIEMEYCEKGDLAKAIINQNGVRFSKRKVLFWLAQLCSAIQYIHGNDILHRDLKSQNIFLKSDDTIKIGDFGIATILENAFAKAHTVCGTIGYLAPEILKNVPYGKKCDIWSLGCVLFEMVTLETPFPQDVFGLISSMVQMPAPVPSDCPESIQNMVGMMLKYEPSERASITTVVEELKKLLDKEAASGGATSQGYVLTDVICNVCKYKVEGIRYTCLQCRNYDMCMKCEKEGKHAEHALMRTSGNIERNWIHVHVNCDACLTSPIRGPRYKCLGCQDFDLCRRCFNSNKHPEHKFAVACEPTT